MKRITNIRYIILSAFAILVTLPIFAQKKALFDHKIIVGYNLGATAPVPIPAEIRSIDAYWPLFTPQLGYSVRYNHDNNWGLESGIQLDYKGMGARDKVKYMYTDVLLTNAEEGGSRMQGYFVGKNETRIKSAYVTIPLYVSYKMNDIWLFRAGGYASYRHSSEFEGTVWDGYLRDVNMDGKKLEIKEKGEATFNFGNDMRDFDFGVGIGTEYRLNQRFGLYSNFTWGLTPIFPSDYKSVDLKMRNIYLTLGFVYHINH